MFNASTIIGLPERQFPYNPMGDTVYVVKKGIGFVKFATKKNGKASGQWLLEKIHSNRYYSLVTLYNSPEPDVIVRFYTLAELATMCDLKRNMDASQRRFAKRIGADVAKRGRFARKGKQVVIPNPGTGEDGDAVFCFSTKNAVKDSVRKLITGPAITGRHGGRLASAIKPGTL